jgi:YihY family inner membrane protein
MKERLQAFDRFQRRHRWLAFPLAVQKKFGEDQGGDLASLLAYYGFFSLFPLLLVFVTVLGFVFQNNPSAQHDIVNSALKDFPIVGDQIKAGTLHGSGLALAIGLVGALVTGLGVTLAAQKAFDRVYAIPQRARANFFKARLRGLEILVVVGMLQIVSTAVSGLVSGGLGGVWTAIASIVVSLALNFALFFAAFRMLTERSIPTSEMWTGIIVATVAWEVLQQVGGIYINHVVKGGSQTYGTFATVIGLLTWLFLGARVLVYSAEINVVRCRHLWPRSLMEPPAPADRKAHDAMARIEERGDDNERSENGAKQRDTVPRR